MSEYCLVQQAINWTNIDPVHWHMYLPPVLNELKETYNGPFGSLSDIK